MYSKVLFFLILAVTLNLGAAIRCHFCIGSLESDCTRGTRSALASQSCFSSMASRMHQKFFGYLPPEGGDYVELCVHLAYEESERFSNNSYRGCALATRGENYCEKLQESAKNLIACRICDTPECNYN